MFGPKLSRKAKALLALFLVGLWPVAFWLGSTSVEGEIRSRGEPFGDYELTDMSCASGEHESFFGVWLGPKMEDEEGRKGIQGVLKLVRPPLGEWSVFVENPNECRGLKCTVHPLDRAECKRFDIDVRDTSTKINDIVVREGHAMLDCRFREGGALTANLKFDGCR